MSLHEPANWLVAYDIGDARRGMRVLKFMKRQGTPVQYSVFLVRATSAGMTRLMADLRRLIAPAVDDVRAYRIPVRTDCAQLGAPLLPDDAWLSADDWQPQTTSVTRVRAQQRPVTVE